MRSTHRLKGFTKELDMNLFSCWCFCPFQNNFSKTLQMPTSKSTSIDFTQFSKGHWSDMEHSIFFQSLPQALRTGQSKQGGLPDTVSSSFLNLKSLHSVNMFLSKTSMSLIISKTAVYQKGNPFTPQMITVPIVLFHCRLLCKYKLQHKCYHNYDMAPSHCQMTQKKKTPMHTGIYIAAA